MPTSLPDKSAVLSQWMLDHGEMVLRVSFYYVKDMMLAEDLAQNVFLRAFEHMESFRRESDVKTWLYRITVNICKDYLRSWQHRKLVFTDWWKHESDAVTTEQQVMAKINRHEMAEQIMKLPVLHREVLFLRYFEDLSTRETAELLGIAEQTVRVRVSRAKEKLKRTLRGGQAEWIL